MKSLFLASLVVFAPAVAQAQWFSYEFLSQEQKETKKSDQDARKSVQEAARKSEELAREANRIAQDVTSQVNEAIRVAQVGAQTVSQLEPALQSARSLRLRGRYTEAAKIYADFIANNKGSARLFEARFWLAKCYSSDRKWDEAADAFTEFLKYHSDQRTYSIQAKEDRIYCWKVRQGQNPKAVPGLKAALRDSEESIRILAALALAENKDASGRRVLEEQGLKNAALREQSALALWKLGIRGQPRQAEGSAPRARMFVIKFKTDDPDNSFEIRVPVNLIKSLEKMLPDEAREEMTHNGVELPNLVEMAASATKGQILFQFKTDNGKTSLVISVE